jgi:hypothetical protein
MYGTALVSDKWKANKYYYYGIIRLKENTYFKIEAIT